MSRHRIQLSAVSARLKHAIPKKLTAVVQLGKSYRYVWGRVKDAETTLRQPLVETRVGGVTEQRSNLTPLADQLVEDFVAFRVRMLEIAGEEFAARFAALKPKVVSARVRGRRA